MAYILIIRGFDSGGFHSKRIFNYESLKIETITWLINLKSFPLLTVGRISSILKT